MSDKPGHQQIGSVVRRLLGFIVVALLYLLLIVAVYDSKNTFDSVFQGLGLEVNWLTKSVVYHPATIVVLLAAMMFFQFVMLIATNWADIAVKTYLQTRNFSICFLVFLYVVALLAFYAPIYTMGTSV